MPDLRLYVAPIPEVDQTGGDLRGRPENALQGLLDQDDVAAERISSPPQTLTIEAQHRGKYADLMAAELDELAESSGYAELPLYAVGEKSAADGYWLAGSRTVGPADRRERRIQDVSLDLERVGTRHSDYRAIVTARYEPDEPYDADERGYLGVPADAREVRWVDRETGESERADPIETYTGEHGASGQLDIDVYDVDDAPTDEPVLTYDLACAGQVPADVRVWDTRGYDDRDDEDGIPVFQKVYVSTHDYEGDPVVVENALTRLTFDEDAADVDDGESGLTVEEWDPDADDGDGAWVDLDLGYVEYGYGEGAYGGGVYDADLDSDPEDWALRSVDVGHRSDQRLGPMRVDLRTRWESVDGEEYDVDCTLFRGMPGAFWHEPPDADDSIPDGLAALLRPSAFETAVHIQPELTLRARSRIE